MCILDRINKLQYVAFYASLDSLDNIQDELKASSNNIYINSFDNGEDACQASGHLSVTTALYLGLHNIELYTYNHSDFGLVTLVYMGQFKVSIQYTH